jgi:hypothetical protein
MTPYRPKNEPAVRSEPGKGDDVPCKRCGAAALDTGLECDECGHDNYEAIVGRPFAALRSGGSPD